MKAVRGSLLKNIREKGEVKTSTPQGESSRTCNCEDDTQASGEEMKSVGGGEGRFEDANITETIPGHYSTDLTDADVSGFMCKWGCPYSEEEFDERLQQQDFRDDIQKELIQSIETFLLEDYASRR